MLKKASVNSALFEGFSEPCRDALWGHVYFTPALEAVTRTPAFSRLNRIAQLGPASLVYPGATHTRAAHSIGVYHIARRLITGLCERGADSFVTAQGIRSFLCAALLHDIGHFPYAHSLKELALTGHEQLGARLIEADPTASLVEKAGADPAVAAAILDTGRATDDKEVLFYRKLLSGCLDPDKLDYLNRDARFAGVTYGTQDVDFILSRLHPSRERGVDIDSKAISSVESVLFSKYLMYRSVYWHKGVRAATAVMKKTLHSALHDALLSPEELYNLDDNGLFDLLRKRRTAGRGKGASSSEALFDAARGLRDGKIWTCVGEVPFDEAKHHHWENREDLQCRAEAEAEISAQYGATVIIDVPERVDFETGLHVLDEDCPFERSSTVFGAETVASFVKTLRTVRFFVDKDRGDLVYSL
ncbi:MAG: HD domain-containing protein [Spirochaetaceae bacterium]|jgi:HD superfamily phosphohydrolase|nr:HD domain-containing protein [Spirochaetaceae bacterium]